jgi:hypothetical protein
MPAKPPVDAEACKTSGNKFFKAKDYDKAVKEYSKGMLSVTQLWHFFHYILLCEH